VLIRGGPVTVMILAHTQSRSPARSAPAVYAGCKPLPDETGPRFSCDVSENLDALHSGVEHLVKLLVGRLLDYLGDNGDIRWSRERVAACGLDIGDDALGGWSVTAQLYRSGNGSSARPLEPNS